MLTDHLTKLKPISNSWNVRVSHLCPLLWIPIIYVAQEKKYVFFCCGIIAKKKKKALQLFYSMACCVLWYVMVFFKGNLLFASIAATNSHKTFCSILAPAQGCDL